MEYTHIRFDIIGAFYAGDKRHAQQVMEDLGIQYEKAVPQTMGDCWQFFNCTNIPETLPDYLNIFDDSPMDFIGYGLSEEDAYKLSKDFPVAFTQNGVKKTTTYNIEDVEVYFSGVKLDLQRGN